MFEPMALTVIIALVDGLRAVADLVAGAHRHRHHRQGHGEWTTSSSGRSRPAYRPVLGRGGPGAFVFVGAALTAAHIGAGILFTRLGTEFIRRLDSREGICPQRHPNPSDPPSPSRRRCSSRSEAWSRNSRRWPTSSRSPATAEVAYDPMPPNSSDTFVILNPQEEWPEPSLSKAELQEQIEKAVGAPRRQTSTSSPRHPAALQRAARRHQGRPRREGVRRRVSCRC